MESEDLKGAPAPGGDVSPPPTSPSSEHTSPATPTDVSYRYPDDGYPYEDSTQSSVATTLPEPVPAPAPVPATKSDGGGKTPPKPPGGGDDGGDDDDDGMLRMSFMEHLEELRTRIIRAFIGIGIAFLGSLVFTNELWVIVSAPATEALKSLGVNPPNLVQISPMETFNIIWVKLPILCAIFISSPWIVFQVWGFIAPGLYKKERRWATPFVLGSAGLFIAGGCFAYFIAFRYGLTFLLGIGRGIGITPMVSVTEYFDLFVNVMLGVGLVFEIPILIFFLTLLRIVSPDFLIRHSRYAILAIVIIAAIVTPTPDVVNLMMFATPMCLLFYVGIFASYLLVLSRENRRFPWKKVLGVAAIVIGILAIALYLALLIFGYHFSQKWPFVGR